MIGVSRAPNRFLLLVTGVLLLLAGLATLALGQGMLSWWDQAPAADDQLLGSGSLPPWAPAAVLALSGLVTVCGLWWALAAIPRSHRAREFQLHDDGRQGVTRLDNGALQQAVGESAQQLNGIVGATVRLQGTAHHPDVTIKVDVDERVDIAATIDRLHSEVLADLETVLEASLDQVRVIVDPVRTRKKSHSATVA